MSINQFNVLLANKMVVTNTNVQCKIVCLLGNNRLNKNKMNFIYFKCFKYLYIYLNKLKYLQPFLGIIKMVSLLARLVPYDFLFVST